MRLRGDIGGFGIGSDLTYNILGAIGHRFTVFGRDAIGLLGYRALYQDYDKGSGPNKFEWDMTMHGPVIALQLGF